MKPSAANDTYKLPPKLFDARCKACWLMLGVVLLVVASFATLNLQWAQFWSWDAAARMGRFFGELLHPEIGRVFISKVLMAALETLAMSALGTLLAVLLGLALALPASKAHAQDPAHWRAATRLLLNALRSTPELVWAALLLIAVGLGPFAGTLAVGLHTAGVLGRRGLVMPERVITKPPSAELKPDQKDQDTLPPYEVLDAILEGLIEGEKSVDALVANGFERATILRIWRMLDRAEYKRRQAPPGVKLRPRAFGRDWRLPIAKRWQG